MTDNRRFLLRRRPDGAPVADDFALVTEPLPMLEEGQFLIRNHYASLDPAMRGWMDDVPSYMPPIPLGAPVRASTVGVVEASRADGFAPGQWVLGLNAIEDFSVAVAGGFTKPIDPAAVPSVTNYLSILGAVGMTAYFGCSKSVNPSPARGCSSPVPRVRSARSLGRSRRSRGAAPSVSPAARRNARG